MFSWKQFRCHLRALLHGTSWENQDSNFSLADSVAIATGPPVDGVFFEPTDSHSSVFRSLRLFGAGKSLAFGGKLFLRQTQGRTESRTAYGYV